METFHLDVRDRTGLSRAADEAESRLGPVSLVINNAGVGSAAPLTGLSHAQWDHVLDINLQQPELVEQRIGVTWSARESSARTS